MKLLTNLTKLPYGDSTMTKWYQVYKKALSLTDVSLFASRENAGLVLIGGGNIAYNSGTGELSWDAPIQLIHPFSAKKNDIVAGNVTGVTPDSYVYVTIRRNIRANGGVIPLTSIKVSQKIPNDDYFYVLFYITETGQIVYNGNNTVTSTPSTIPHYFSFEDIDTGDFPANASEEVVNHIKTIKLDSQVDKTDKVVRFQFRTDSNFQADDYHFDMILSVDGNGNDLYYTVNVNKVSEGGSILSTNIVNNVSKNFTPATINELITYQDDSVLALSPSEIYSIEITFLNSNASYLGANNSVNLYALHLSNA